MDLFRTMIGKQTDKPTMRALANFLKMYVPFSKQESHRIFNHQLASITSKNTTIGIEELILQHFKEDGKAEGKG
ncbi:MAG: hypothetical protein EAY75_09635 [Bacteroidetes bacterium]|nr:MAG: hypothetical protein EAY75_09635 [Bacteroidota bacterium]